MFFVRVFSPASSLRELISAYDYKNGNWIDVTESEKNKKIKGEARTQKFSLLEMVAPDKREEYRIQLISDEQVENYQTICSVRLIISF